MLSLNISLEEAAEFWLEDLMLPITPNSLEIKNNNTNESKQTVDGTPMTIVKRDKAQSFTISFLVPFLLDYYADPFLVNETSNVENVKRLTDYLWSLKWKEPTTTVLTIIYPDGSSINGEFMLDDYSYKQDAANGSDYEFTISLTEYYPPNNYELSGQLRNSLVEQGIRNPRRLD